MAYTTGAISSPRQMAAYSATTVSATVYTAPAYTTNVSSPSATAIIKEIIIANINSGTSAGVSISINPAGGTGGYYIMLAVPISAQDSKVLTGMNLMLPAGASVNVFASANSSIQVIISGVEVQ